MRTPFRLPAVTLVLVAALAVSGCTPDKPAPVPSVSQSGTPLFASDEEALAAAEEAYAAYLAVSDRILMDGGANPERLLEVATSSVLEAQLDGFETAAANGWRSTGGTVVGNVSLERYDPNEIEATVLVYACIDVSLVDVLDSSGHSVVSEARPNRTPVESTFDASETTASRLLLSGEIPWSGANFCM